MSGFQRIGGDTEMSTDLMFCGNKTEITIRPIFKSRVAVITDTEEASLRGKAIMPINGKLVVFPDMYFLRRALMHGSETYLRLDEGELAKLKKAMQNAYRLNAILLGLSKDNADELMLAIAEQVETMIAAVNPDARLELKKQILSQLEAIGHVNDSLNRINPSALLARLVAVTNRLTKRETAAGGITSIFALRRKAAELCIDILEYHVLCAADYLVNLFKKWDQVIGFQRKGTANQLKIYAQVFRIIDILPFERTFSHSADEFEKASVALRSNRVTEAKDLLRISLSSFLLRKARIELEQVAFAVSRQKRFNNPDFDCFSWAKKLAAVTDSIQTIDTSGMQNFPQEVVCSYLYKAIKEIEVQQCSSAHDSMGMVIALV
ncbi:MAG: hypothetical protein WCT08_00130 [Patescibacteria group bacterium]|jgi:hypothetical protein